MIHVISVSASEEISFAFSRVVLPQFQDVTKNLFQGFAVQDMNVQWGAQTLQILLHSFHRHITIIKF
jgi:hypothetical protein